MKLNPDEKTQQFPHLKEKKKSVARVCPHVITVSVERTMSFPFPAVDGMWRSFSGSPSCQYADKQA